MKRYVFIALTLAIMMIYNNVSVYAQVPINETQETVQKTVLECCLTYGKIQSITHEGDTLKSITTKDIKGHTDTYQIAKQTVFVDGSKKIKLDASILKEGDAVYIYHTLATAPASVTAEAIVANVPMDTACATLHTVEALSTNSDGTFTITSEQDGIKLTADRDVIVKDYSTNNTLQISDIKIGSRFFTWYDSVEETYPARASIKEILVLPITEALKKVPGKDITKNKAVYQKESLPIVNGTFFVPLRETATKLGLSIAWDAKNRITKLESDTRSMNFMEGKDSYVSSTTIEGAVGMTAPLKLGAAPFIHKTNVMYVPAEAFRALVGYDVIIADDTITIVNKEKL